LQKKSVQYHVSSMQDAAYLITHLTGQVYNPFFCLAALRSFIIKHFFS